MAPEVATVMQTYLKDHYGNPSSGHWAARGAKTGLETARAKVARLLNCDTDEIVFTSGGTESNNLALKGVWFNRKRQGNHIITSKIEHDAIREPLAFLKRHGANITYVGVDDFGRINPEDVKHALRADTALVSIMHANNETGMIQPINKIAHIVKNHGAIMHTDAAQSVGKIQIDLTKLPVDLLSLSGHKFYGPKGIGALFVRQGLRVESHNHGAGHEKGRRAGTESVLLAAGLGAACELARFTSYDSVRNLRDAFWFGLSERFGDKVRLNGSLDHCVPNTLSVCFEGQVGAELLSRLDGVAAATGSACHAGCVDMSKVLIAMRVPVKAGMGAIRFSLGHHNTQAEVDTVLTRLEQIL